MKQFLLYIPLFFSVSLFAQTDIDTLFSGAVGFETKTIKKDSAGTYFSVTTHPDRIYYWSNSWDLKIFDLNNILLVEGKIGHRVCSELVLKAGKWKSYHLNGNIKTEGYYERNRAVGLWKSYYPNGELQKIYNLAMVSGDSTYSICMAGTYEEYYPGGQVKVSGLYRVMNDTVSVEEVDPLTNSLKPVVIKMPVSKKSGKWLHYLPNGDIERKEDY